MKTKLLGFFLLMLSLSAFGQAKPGFYVNGRFLYDRYGEKTILRGVNEMSVWAGGDPTGAVYMPEIRKTGANCVRIVWTMAPANSLTTLDQLIQNCVKSNMIPMIEIHDATGRWDLLPSVFSYWTRPDVVALIKKHENYLLVNIANEAGDGSETDLQFRTAYATGIQSMRAAGIHTNIVVDANNWGQRIETLNNTANFILREDPDHNVMFSVHTYWSIFAGNTTAVVKAKLQSAVDAGYCLILGEFNKYGGWGGAANLACSAPGICDYVTMIEECQKHSIGWLAWSWGTASNTGGGNPLCTVMDMAPGGQFTALQAGWATEVATTSPFSIKNTSVTPKSMFPLSRPLIVPEFCNGLVKFYPTNTPTTALASHTLNIASLCANAKPNGVALKGNDLYVNVNVGCGRIYKYTYLTLGNAAIPTQVTSVSNDYVGIVFNENGDMYTTEGVFGDNQLVRYSAGANLATRTVLGNAGVISYFANIAIDASSNVWVSDYKNNRLVVYKPDGTYRVLYSYDEVGGVAVGNAYFGFQTPANKVFSKPEGMAFDKDGNLWVANNNDDGSNTYGTLVKLSISIQNMMTYNQTPGGLFTLMKDGGNGQNQVSGYTVYNVPSPAMGHTDCFGTAVARAQLGGMVIDKSSELLYVNEQQGGKAFKFSIPTIATITNNYTSYTIDIVSTNAGNGGICFGDNPPAAPTVKNYRWTGNSAALEGNWANYENWEVNGTNFSDGTYPNSTAGIIANVVFNSYAGTVNVPDGIVINSLAVKNGENNTFSSVTLAGTTNNVVLTLKREDLAATTPSLAIENKATLSLSTPTDVRGFTLQNDASVVNNLINGSLVLEGGVTSLPVVYKNATPTGTTITTVVGGNPFSLYFDGLSVSGQNAMVSNSSPSTLIFQNSGTYQHGRNGGEIPNANYKITSAIKVTGVTTTLPTFNTSSIYEGNLVWDCRDMTTTADLNLPKGTGSGTRGSISVQHGFLSLTGSGTTDVFTSISRGFGLGPGPEPILKINTPDFRVLNDVNSYGIGNLQINGATSSLCVGGKYRTNAYVNLLGNGKLKIMGNIFIGNVELVPDDVAPAPVSSTLQVLKCQAQCTCSGTAVVDVEIGQFVMTPVVLPNNGMYNLKINNGGGVTTINGPIQVDKLDLTNGVIQANATITLTENATITGGSPTSYIDGLVAKKTNSTTPFTLPTGNNGSYKPITITPENATPTTFSARFVNNIPPNRTALTSPLTGLLNTYADISRTSGTSNAKISLSFDALPQGVQTVVAHFNSTTNTWQMEGGLPTIVSSGTGVITVTTSNFVSSFSPFALATTPPALTRPLIVPEFCNGVVKFYTTDNPTTALASHTLNVTTPMLPTSCINGKPNCVALKGNDLYVNLNDGCGRIYKYTNYLNLGNTATPTLVTNVNNDYVGIAFNENGDMYTTEGVAFGNNQLVKYSGANLATRTVLGNAGMTSYLANIAFDAGGNVWASDYKNNRIVVLKPDGSFRILASSFDPPTGYPVGNTVAALQTPANKVFSKPEGLAFDKDGNLWVGNNNDDGANPFGTLVKITPALQTQVINWSLDPYPPLGEPNGFIIYNLPNPAAGHSDCFAAAVARAQPGGVVIDTKNEQLYVNEQQGGKGFRFNIPTIANIENNYDTYSIAIASTNAGNGGICFGDNPPVSAPCSVVPTNLTATVNVNNTATITWTAGSTETAWDIYIASTRQDMPTRTSTPSVSNLLARTHTLNLASNTTYRVYVRAKCATNSDWIGSVFFSRNVSRPLKSWGNNEYYQIGDGTTTNRTGPTQPSLPIEVNNLWRQVAGGDKFTVAIKHDGTLWAWGNNAVGQVGDGTTTTRIKPVQISTNTDWVQIAVGNEHTLALKSNGTVYSWGANDFGQLGLSSFITIASNPSVVNNLNGVSEVAAGKNFSVALLSDGSIRTWGNNTVGQLGNGQNVMSHEPVPVANINSAIQVDCGLEHTLALLADGTVKGWGHNGYAQMGEGTLLLYNKNTPISIPNLSSVKQVACGGIHSVALLNDGTMKAWGYGQNGELGGGAFWNVVLTFSIIPQDVLNITNAVKIAAGNNHTLALLADGTVKTWGYNASGQLGDATTTSNATPNSILGINIGDAIQIGAGTYTSYALTKIEFGIGLPLELLDFSGHTEGGQNVLNWLTASEKNVAHFDIERSGDGKNFEKIGQVKATNAVQSKHQTYTFTDIYSDRLATNILYYRLKINDLDGKSNLSKTISVAIKSKSTPLSIFPNPADKIITIRLETGEFVDGMTLTDMLGRTVFTKQMTSTKGVKEWTIDLPDLPAGAYWLRMGGEMARLVIR